jgi:hypothetical protein
MKMVSLIQIGIVNKSTVEVPVDITLPKIQNTPSKLSF